MIWTYWSSIPAWSRKLAMSPKIGFSIHFSGGWMIDRSHGSGDSFSITLNRSLFHHQFINILMHSICALVFIIIFFINSWLNITGYFRYCNQENACHLGWSFHSLFRTRKVQKSEGNKLFFSHHLKLSCLSLVTTLISKSKNILFGKFWRNLRTHLFCCVFISWNMPLSSLKAVRYSRISYRCGAVNWLSHRI